MPVRKIIHLLAIFVTSPVMFPAQAAEAPAVAADKSACMEVEVNGQRAPSFSCLTQKLTPPADTKSLRPTPSLASEAVITRPSNQLGLSNLAATMNRMGNTFGTSVRPQRPGN